MEVSIVDIPANSNAVRLYDSSTSVLLAAGMDTKSVPALPTNSLKVKMKFKQSWSAFLSFLNINKDNAETIELSAENLDALNNEFVRLKSDHDALVQAKQNVDQQLTNANSEIATLKTSTTEKDQEIIQLKNDATQKDTEITQLKEKVENLKKVPAPGEKGLSPKTEPGADTREELATFCDKNAGNYGDITKRLKEEGLLP